MQFPPTHRIIQIVISIALFTFTGLSWRFNEIGQNIINLTASTMFLIGLDNILIYYRCWKEKNAIEHEATFGIFCFFVLGIVFQSFRKNQLGNLVINQICKYAILGVLGLNFSYYAFVLLILIFYLFRQIYRLMTETLLSSNTQISPQTLQAFLNTNKQFYSQLKRKIPGINNSCSICLGQFEQNSENEDHRDRHSDRDPMCILLPSCQHCFHLDCIQEWLKTKSTCPYCRYNIQLDIVVGGEE